MSLVNETHKCTECWHGFTGSDWFDKLLIHWRTHHSERLREMLSSD